MLSKSCLILEKKKKDLSTIGVTAMVELVQEEAALLGTAFSYSEKCSRPVGFRVQISDNITGSHLTVKSLSL